MKIPAEVLKAVGFVCYQDQSTGALVPVGSFFFLGHDAPNGSTISPRMYAVTALHVIQGLKSKGVLDTYLRLNPKVPDQNLIGVRLPLAKWTSHSTDKSIDAAIAEIGIPAEADHLVLPFSICANEQTFSANEVTLGDEVFISGFFNQHFGTSRNIPVVRTGNLAALGEEKISTEAFGAIDGLLVEARSTGGLSGSPVFLNLGIVRSIGGNIKYSTSGETAFFLIGLIHGHFLAKAGASGAENINAGIAIVVSVASIRSVITDYELANSTK